MTAKETEQATKKALPSFEAAGPPKGTAASTIEALLYEFRGGLSCLTDSSARDRLLRCDANAMRIIANELLGWEARNKPWLPAWSPDDVAKLTSVWQAMGPK